jgi:hypothetical protein
MLPEAEMRDLRFEVNPASTPQRKARSYLKNKLGMVVHTCNPNYYVSRGKKIMS